MKCVSNELSCAQQSNQSLQAEISQLRIEKERFEEEQCMLFEAIANKSYENKESINDFHLLIEEVRG